MPYPRPPTLLRPRPTPTRPGPAARPAAWQPWFALAVGALLSACGGGSGGEGAAGDTHAPARASAESASAASADTRSASASNTGTTAATGGAGSTAAAGTTTAQASPSTGAATAPTVLDAVRLAHQASFGPTEALVSEIRSRGIAGWLREQTTLKTSRYSRGNGDAVHRWTGSGDYCAQPALGTNCWRDWMSTAPLVWDFYRNAVNQPDQLRQRVAFALSQIVVVSNLEVSGTYGFRNFHNMLLDNALGSYRQVLKKVALSPVMGEYLDNVNNDKASPNENFARELLQLFAIGTCQLEADGSLKGGSCQPTYDNARVRSYAYALTGWTYPAGGASASGCWPRGTNCRYYNGDMVAAPERHEPAALGLLSGVTVPAGSSPASALESVLDSLMAHPSMAPFIGRQLIQHLVMSNPSPAYVGRVSAAFSSGRHSSGGIDFGTGQRGDLAATVAAVLLDAEARTPRSTGAKLREPALMMAGVLRAFNARTDGEPFAWYWGGRLRQHVFSAPSVFNFYAPDYPVPGTELQGPQFGIHGASTALQRLNFLTYLLWWDGSAPVADVPGAIGTKVDLTRYLADVGDPGKLVDRFSTLAVGGPLPAATREPIVSAVAEITARNSQERWQLERVRQAAYLVFSTPEYHVHR